MNPELLCRWLDLQPGTWPPEAHSLLGLPAEERDAVRIEQKVHERMCLLRGYQISHPEEATEGMNRVAQAFMALTVGSVPCGCAPASTEAAPPNGTPTQPQDPSAPGTRQVDWQSAPPPVRRPGAKTPLPTGPSIAVEPPPVRVRARPAPAPQAAPQAAPPPPTESPAADPLVALAQQSPECRSGLRSLPKLIDRIYHTRHLLAAWNAFGRDLRDARRRPTKFDEQAFVRHLAEIERQVSRYPAIVGCPGKPGYRVVAMARLQMSPAMLRAMDPVERELLTVDWTHGRDVLMGYRKFLRALFKRMRHRGPVSLAVHAFRSLVLDHPGVILATLTLLAGAAYWLWWHP